VTVRVRLDGEQDFGPAAQSFADGVKIVGQVIQVHFDPGWQFFHFGRPFTDVPDSRRTSRVSVSLQAERTLTHGFRPVKK